MAKPSEKLAEPLKILKALQDVGEIAIHTSRLTRAHKERLYSMIYLWVARNSNPEPPD